MKRATAIPSPTPNIVLCRVRQSAGYATIIGPGSVRLFESTVHSVFQISLSLSLGFAPRLTKDENTSAAAEKVGCIFEGWSLGDASVQEPPLPILRYEFVRWVINSQLH